MTGEQIERVRQRFGEAPTQADPEPAGWSKTRWRVMGLTVFGPLSVIGTALALHFGWAWFAVPFGAPDVPTAALYGGWWFVRLCVVDGWTGLGLAALELKRAQEEDHQRAVLMRLASVGHPWAILGFMWVCHAVMP